MKSGSSSSLITGLLGIAFVVLKLCHIIDWSWWWVTAPFWGPLALVLAICAVYLVYLSGAVSLRYVFRRRGSKGPR